MVEESGISRTVWSFDGSRNRQWGKNRSLRYVFPVTASTDYERRNGKTGEKFHRGAKKRTVVDKEEASFLRRFPGFLVRPLNIRERYNDALLDRFDRRFCLVEADAASLSFLFGLRGNIVR